MARLTNNGRTRIRDMILAHKFDALEAALRREEEILAQRVYDKMYTAEQRQGMDVLVASAPGKIVFCAQTPLRVNAGGWTVDLRPAAPVPVWECHEGIWRGFHTSLAGKLCDETKAFAERKKALNEQRSHLARQVEGQLGAHFTFDKLREAWPEVDRFVSAVEASLPAPSTLPALADHEALNVALDLPPAVKDAA